VFSPLSSLVEYRSFIRYPISVYDVLGAVEQISYAPRYTRPRKQRSFFASEVGVVTGTEKTNNNGMTGESLEQHCSVLLKR